MTDVSFTNDTSNNNSHRDIFQVNRLKIKTRTYTEKNDIIDNICDNINYNDYITNSPGFKMPPPKPPTGMTRLFITKDSVN